MQPLNGFCSRLTALCLLSLGSSLNLFAQESPSSSSSANNGLDEIVVTAQKRTESVVEVPIAITVLSEAALEEAGAVSMGDYLRYVPGVSFGNQNNYPHGGVVPAIRGVQAGNQATTSLYIDELPLQPLEFTRVGLPDPDIFDIERIEVLKGPQGTLYGSAAMGGTIRVITNKPDPNNFDARIVGEVNGLSGGGFGDRTDVMVNIPIVPGEAALRIVGTYLQDGGYVKQVDGGFFLDNVTNGNAGTNYPGQSLTDVLNSQSRSGYNNSGNLASFRATLGLNLVDTVKVAPAVLYQKTDYRGGNIISSTAYSETGGGAYFPVFQNGTDDSFTQYLVFSLPITISLPFGSIVSSTGYFDHQYARGLATARFIELYGATDEQLESISNPVVRDSGTERQFVEEVRFTSDFKGPFNFIAGLFDRDVIDRFTQNASGPDYLRVFGDSVFYYGLDRSHYKEKAAFADGTFQLGNFFELGGGLRYYDYSRALGEYEAGLLAEDGFSAEPKNHGVLYSATASWFPTGKDSKDSQVYFRTASGFRPGFGQAVGFLTDLCKAELAGQTLDGVIDQDSLKSYELGGKYRTKDGMFNADIAGYHIDWSNVQVVRRLNCGSSIQGNAGDAKIDGAEFQMALSPLAYLHFTGGFSYNHSRFVNNSVTADEAESLTGDWNGSFGIDLTPQSGVGGAQGLFHIGYTYSPQIFYGSGETPPYPPNDPRRALSLWDMRIGATHDKWDVSIFSTNLTNVNEPGQCFDSGFPIPGERITCRNEPRKFGMRVERRY